MGSSTPATTTQTQNSTNTTSPWTAATPLLQNLINTYGGMSTALTPAQQAAGGTLTSAAGDLASTSGAAMPQAESLSGAAAPLTGAAANVAGAAAPLTGAAQNVWQSSAPLTGAAWGMLPATGAQMPAAYNLMNAAGGVNALAPQSTAAVQQLFGNAGMIPSAYQGMQSNLNPIATGSLNPYSTPGFSDALDTLTQNITNQVKGSYAASGRDPSGAGTMPQTLARGLMQGEAPFIQSQYNQNVANVGNANQMLMNAGISGSQAMSGNTMAALQGAGMLPGLQMAPAQAQWGASQAPMQAAQNYYTAAGMPLQAAMTQYGAAGMPLQAAQTQYGAATQPLQAAQTQLQAANTPYSIAQQEWQAAQAPWTAANQVYGQPYANINQLLAPSMALGGMGGTTTGTGTAYGTQTPANNPFMNLLGGISTGAGLLGSLGTAGGAGGIPALFAGLSDRRAKTDIKSIGKTHDKQNIYSFKYKGSNMPQIGMMADEVEKRTPEAVVRGPDGFKRVNYDRATRKAATMGMLQAA